MANLRTESERALRKSFKELVALQAGLWALLVEDYARGLAVFSADSILPHIVTYSPEEIAYILIVLSPKIAQDIMMNLDAETRQNVLRFLLVCQQVPAQKIDSAQRRLLLALREEQDSSWMIDSRSQVAKMLFLFPSSELDILEDQLDTEEKEQLRELRNHLICFDDILHFTGGDIKDIIMQVGLDNWFEAMKGAPEAYLTCSSKGLSKAMYKELIEYLSFSKSPRPNKDARAYLCQAIGQMLEDGRLDFPLSLLDTELNT